MQGVAQAVSARARAAAVVIAVVAGTLLMAPGAAFAQSAEPTYSFDPAMVDASNQMTGGTKSFLVTYIIPGVIGVALVGIVLLLVLKGGKKAVKAA